MVSRPVEEYLHSLLSLIAVRVDGNVVTSPPFEHGPELICSEAVVIAWGRRELNRNSLQRNTAVTVVDLLRSREQNVVIGIRKRRCEETQKHWDRLDTVHDMPFYTTVLMRSNSRNAHFELFPRQGEKFSMRAYSVSLVRL
jgi:hypothetical protein